MSTGSSAGRLGPPREWLPSPLASVGQLAEKRDASRLGGVGGRTRLPSGGGESGLW